MWFPGWQALLELLYGFRVLFQAGVFIKRAWLAVRHLTTSSRPRYFLSMFYPKALSLLALSAIGMPFLHAQPNPVKLAAQARFYLFSSSVTLEKAQVLQGMGRIERPSWVAEAARSRSYTANFSVTALAGMRSPFGFCRGRMAQSNSNSSAPGKRLLLGIYIGRKSFGTLSKSP